MRYQRATSVLDEVVDGRHMLVTPDGTELLTLNETGSHLWDRLADPATLEDLVERLAEEFEVDRALLEEDAQSFVEELRAVAVIAVVEPT